MQSELALPPAIVFSDSAVRERATGKLTLAGVFHRFAASQIPFTSPAFFATVFVTNIRGRIQDLPVTMNIEDSSGNVVSSATGSVSSKTEIGLRDVAEISFPIPPTVFDKAGHYKAVVQVDNESLGWRLFFVQKAGD